MKRIAELWQRVTSSHYNPLQESQGRIERELRDEVARLRAENRALLNSILGIAGVPPIPSSSAEPLPPLLHAAPTGPDAPAAGPAPPFRAPRAHARNGATTAAIPTRRRSWHQINRILEFESTKKEEVASD